MKAIILSIVVLSIIQCVHSLDTNTEHILAARSTTTRDLKGIFNSPTGNDAFTAFISWNATQNESAKASTITATLYIEKTGVHNNPIQSSSQQYSITIDGDTFEGKSSFCFSKDDEVRTQQVLGYASKTVTHNDDGTRDVFINATFTVGGTSLGTVTVNGTATLDPFPAKVAVTLDPNGGNVPESSMNVTYGDFYGPLPKPTREGHTFIGWHTESSGGTIITSDTFVSKKVAHTLYAYWTLNTYNVTFIKGGMVIKSDLVEYGEDIVLPEAHLENCEKSLDYWCTDPDLTTQFTETTMPANNITLYAKITKNNHTVTLNYMNGTSENITYECGTPLTLPEPSTKKCYTFDGWFLDESLSIIVPESTITTDIVVYAKFTKTNYTVTLNYMNGTSENTSYECGTLLRLPTPSTRDCYVFNGWCLDESLSLVVPESTITTDITVFAKFTKTNLVVTLNYMNGTIENTTHKCRTQLTLPIPSTRDCYAFNEWFLDESLSIIVPEENVTTDITVYAKFTKTNYTVTFNYMNGTIENITHECGSQLTLPTPNRTGYTFGAWCLDPDCSLPVPSTPEQSITSDIILYAKWNETASEYVEIVFGTKGLSEERIKEIIGKYTDDDFEIAKYDSDTGGEEGTRVIIKFTDAKEAESFVEEIRKSSEAEYVIKKVDFVLGKVESISSMVQYSSVLLYSIF